MAERRPIAIVGGRSQEIADTDSIPPPILGTRVVSGCLLNEDGWDLGAWSAEGSVVNVAVLVAPSAGVVTRFRAWTQDGTTDYCRLKLYVDGTNIIDESGAGYLEATHDGGVQSTTDFTDATVADGDVIAVEIAALETAGTHKRIVFQIEWQAT